MPVAVGIALDAVAVLFESVVASAGRCPVSGAGTAAAGSWLGVVGLTSRDGHVTPGPEALVILEKHGQAARVDDHVGDDLSTVVAGLGLSALLEDLP